MCHDRGVLETNDDRVALLRKSIGSAGHNLATVPAMVEVIVRDDGWQDRIVRATGERVQFSSFAEFVTTPPLEGLGATLDQLRSLCRQDPAALDAIDRATQNVPSAHAGNNVPSRPEGNTSAKALRRLRKDRPDLHAEVLAGHKSPHKAMVEAGFRPKTTTGPLSADGVVRCWLKLPDEQRRDALQRMTDLSFRNDERNRIDG